MTYNWEKSNVSLGRVGFGTICIIWALLRCAYKTQSAVWGKANRKNAIAEGSL